MATLAANGINIEYDDTGDRNAPAILLIMGFAMQLIAWPDALCAGLAGRGFRVIRFDNRDIGLSTKIESAAPVSAFEALTRAMKGEAIEAPYTLRDMALDAIGVLDGLEIDKAHIVGASMGGMIAQIVAAEHAARARSLVSIMSTSGNPKLPQAKPEAMAALLAPRATEREAAIVQSMKTNRIIGSPGFPTSDADLRAKVERGIDRCFYPPGLSRQFVAILASGSRVEMLKRVRVPTLVLHGADDPLVPVEGGKETAALVPGAKLEIIPGMGHDFAAGLVPILVNAIARHCHSVDAAV